MAAGRDLSWVCCKSTSTRQRAPALLPWRDWNVGNMLFNCHHDLSVYVCGLGRGSRTAGLGNVCQILRSAYFHLFLKAHSLPLSPANLNPDPLSWPAAERKENPLTPKWHPENQRQASRMPTHLLRGCCRRRRRRRRTTVPPEPSSWSVSSGRAVPGTPTSTRCGPISTSGTSKCPGQAQKKGASPSLSHSPCHLLTIKFCFLG